MQTCNASPAQSNEGLASAIQSTETFTMHNCSQTPDAIDTIVAQWQQERPDLETSAMALLGRLSRCAHLLAPMLAAEFQRFDLNAGEFDVLASLRRAGAPFVLSPTQLYATLLITSGTMTHRLTRLEQRGLITREPNPDDSRSLLVRLSEKGQQLIDHAVTAHLANEQRLLADLPATARQQLEAGLRALLATWEPIAATKAAQTQPSALAAPFAAAQKV